MQSEVGVTAAGNVVVNFFCFFFSFFLFTVFLSLLLVDPTRLFGYAVTFLSFNFSSHFPTLFFFFEPLFNGNIKEEKEEGWDGGDVLDKKNERYKNKMIKLYVDT